MEIRFFSNSVVLTVCKYFTIFYVYLNIYMYLYNMLGLTMEEI
jgi:hypothetical protein